MSEHSSLSHRVTALEKAAAERKPFGGKFLWPFAGVLVILLLTCNLWLIHQSWLLKQKSDTRNSFWVLCHGAYPANDRARAFLELVAIANKEWRGAHLNGLQLEGVALPNADLRGTDFTGSSLARGSFIGTKFSNTRFRQADLTEADFSSADLAGADLNKALLPGAQFRQANLRGANLEQVEASHASFIAAELPDAYLLMANLTGANLSAADLSGANLEGATLKGANFSLARLNGVHLKDAVFIDCNWWRARGLSSNQITFLKTEFPPTEQAAVSLREDYQTWLRARAGK